MGLLILGLTIYVIWVVWGKLFEPKKDEQPTLKKWSAGRLENWISEAENVLRDPRSTDKERKDAIRDIDTFSGILNKWG